MNDKITKNDIARYVRNELDRARRREIEMASRTDPQIQQWFEELAPTDEELDRLPVPEFRLDPEASRRLGVNAYLSVERDEDTERLAAWMKEPDAPEGNPPCDIVPMELLEGGNGTLLYREPAPPIMAADQETFTVPPPDVPRIYPDYTSKQLIIRQRLERVPSGKVEIRVVRRRGEEQVEKFPSKRVELKRVDPPEGEPYWDASVDLESLIGDFSPGDDFIYCVEAVVEG